MKRKMRVAGFLVGFSLLCFASGPPRAFAQAVTGGYVGGTIAGRPVPDDIVGGFAVGVQGGYRFPGGLLLSGEYMYAGRDYYYFDFDGDRTWKQAASWSEVPSGDANRSEWLFLRERHVIGVSTGFSIALGPVGIYGAPGFTLSLIDLSDAEDDYPEFGEAARESSIGEGTAELSPSLRAGLVFPADSLVSGQLSYGVVFRADDEVTGGEYLWRNSLISIAVVLNLGAVPGAGL